jgi:uncharacterized protein YjbJ (UPF0337 family)
MGKHLIERGAKQVKGSVETTLGDATHDAETKAEGTAD